MTSAPLTDREISLVRTSLAVVAPQATEMTVYFYAILFTRHPEVRGLFPENMDVQRDRLLRGLLRIIDLVDDVDNLVQFCSRLGRDHRKFGALDAHYPAVGDCLLASLARYAGTAWNAEIAAAWTRAYTVAAQVMIAAAEDDTRLRPAAWEAQIIRHEYRGNGIAEITVQPDQPYPYVAGQYVSMETPWYPRTWRHYSPAHRPRTDHSMTFHVRAVHRGQVSNALVHHAAAGHRVRLGSPQGEMTLAAAGDRDLLLVAGGTGLAPIRALIEEAAARDMRRYVELFVGARTAEELYGLDDMLRLTQRHHWLTVRAAVSHEHIPGQRGTLPQVLREFGPWYRHEAFLCGPPDMVTTAVRTLLEQGTPRSRIHHDPLDTPVLTAPLTPPRPSQEIDQP
ncbi:FAD-binding oxidoreductase [Streptomyces poriferorum]|uniref:globin domain-containing protein n=1 Tax=Streptomyces TaxID=1883 RepID=UPI001C5DF274|nr:MULTISPECIES: globin domain-containing protein [Streptomyces]MBW5248971.1 flavohemoprotein [Streptomyces poriferorum]MBW5257038.1 flavohemoprotein [Streptomyces poriferorum]WLQ51307.1 FAD-binding oxidoreductase [Streptomyces sp. Alt1]WSI66149.1 FAD-binding oxidoreductase [Streptomyces sp. NBC_01336]